MKSLAILDITFITSTLLPIDENLLEMHTLPLDFRHLCHVNLFMSIDPTSIVLSGAKRLVRQ